MDEKKEKTLQKCLKEIMMESQEKSKIYCGN